MEWASPTFRFINFLLVAHSAKFKMKYLMENFEGAVVETTQNYKTPLAVITAHAKLICCGLPTLSLEPWGMKKEGFGLLYRNFLLKEV